MTSYRAWSWAMESGLLLESASAYLHTSKILEDRHTAVLSSGCILRVTERSVSSDLSHQLVQKAEIERDTSCVATSLVLGRVVPSTISKRLLEVFMRFDIELFNYVWIFDSQT